MADDDWDSIVKDASPECYGQSAEASQDDVPHRNPHDQLPVPPMAPRKAIDGLLNVHVFGLANCLKRPIIVFDEMPLSGQEARMEFGGIFLPLLVAPEDCARYYNTPPPPARLRAPTLVTLISYYPGIRSIRRPVCE